MSLYRYDINDTYDWSNVTNGNALEKKRRRPKWLIYLLKKSGAKIYKCVHILPATERLDFRNLAHVSPTDECMLCG